MDFHRRLSEDLNWYDIIILKAHANCEEICLAKNFILSSLSSPEMSQLRMHTKIGTAIVLECYNAAKYGGIAKKISLYCPDARVYASTDSISAFNGRSYDDRLDPTFYATSGFFNNRIKETTVLYRNGNRVIILKPDEHIV